MREWNKKQIILGDTKRKLNVRKKNREKEIIVGVR